MPATLMSHTLPLADSRRKTRSSRGAMSLEVNNRFPGVTVRLDHSLRHKQRHRSHLHRSCTEADIESMRLAESLQPISSLPPAVANVPAEDIQGYAHTKKVYNYLVGATLGEGSFAKVKEALHVLVGEKVAMKIIDKKKALQDTYVAKNFKREARLLQKVHHPNIIQLYEVIETENNYYLITELCSGGELMQHIYKHHHLTEEETRKYIRQIVSAVDHLHKAGILHRDLKVENLLLDHNKDIKIIDFGLSNEEFTYAENGEELRCRTQCGSPAYAAPELLGQKEYGTAVDVWSIGVNMYAMLTGALPFTVEPFNITALHAKMLQNKINPIPSHLTDSCKDLLSRMLVSNPDQRISMADIFSHPWLNENHRLPFEPAPYPSNYTAADIKEEIIEHMVVQLGLSAPQIKQDVMMNKATSNYSVYHLLESRLARYNREFKPTASKRKPTGHSQKKVSKDLGYYDGEDDALSTATAPSRLGTRGGRRTGAPTVANVLMRTNPSRHARPVSDIPDPVQPLHKPPHRLNETIFRRRSSVPTSAHIADYHTWKRASTNTQTAATRKMSPPTDPVDCEPYAPVYPKSVPHSLQQLAWQGSESPLESTFSPTTAYNGFPESNDTKVGFFIESPDISQIHLPTLPSSGKSKSRTLPLPVNQSRGRSPTRQEYNSGTQESHYHNPRRKISPSSSTGNFPVKTELPVEAIIGELLRVTDSLSMKTTESRHRDTISCTHNHIHFEVSVRRSSSSTCVLHFEWLSGGSHKSFDDTCKNIISRIYV